MSEFYLDPSLFFPALILYLMMFCARVLSELMIPFSTHHVTNHLTRPNKLRQALILQIKIFGKYFCYSSAIFWFWSVKIWYLKLSIQGQTLEAAISNWLKESCFKDLEFFTEDSWNFTKNVPLNQTFPSLSLQSVPFFSMRRRYTHSWIQNIKGCLNTFKAADKALSFSHSII